MALTQRSANALRRIVSQNKAKAKAGRKAANERFASLYLNHSATPGKMRPADSGGISSANSAPHIGESYRPFIGNSGGVSRNLSEPKINDNRPKLTQAGIEWLAINLNPFRQDGHSIKDLVPRFPDGSAHTIGAVLTGTTNFNGGVATSGFITLLPPNYTAGQVGVIHHGNDATNPANSPTTNVPTTAPEYSFFGTIFDNYQWRVIGGGINVTYTGALTHGGGTLRAGWSNVRLQTDAAAWNTYEHYINSITQEIYQLKDGITVSMPVSSEQLQFHTAQANYYSIWPQGMMPIVQFSGLEAAASAVITVRWILYLEIQIAPRIYPYAIGNPVSEADLPAIIGFANSHSRITAGKSFKSVMKAIGKGALSVFKFVLHEAAFLKRVLA